MSNFPPADSTASQSSRQVLSAQQVEEIYRQYHGELLAFLIGVLRNRDQANEALQQTFQKVTEFGGTARSETLRGWLFQVAFREALLIRRLQHRESRQQERLSRVLSRSPADVSPAERLVTAEEVERLRRAVESLPAEQRQIVELRMQGETTFVEIAGSLGTPLGTVLTRMRTAIQKLRKLLHDD
jgi:RNA polymerase sigma-70 factor (ECF subfamily)